MYMPAIIDVLNGLGNIDARGLWLYGSVYVFRIFDGRVFRLLYGPVVKNACGV